LSAKDSLCVALDGSDRDWILSTARELGSEVGWLKVGLEAFTAHGPALVGEVAAFGPRVFLDLKLHDIPATVERAAANCAACGASMFTVHAAGGRAMLEAAAAGARSGAVGEKPRIVAVTVLTSLDGAALAELDIPRAAADLVGAWAKLAQRCGLDGVVASAHEAAALRRDRGRDFLIVTPGIRPESSSTDDQRRVVTPADAVEAGADVLVVGRPITRAPNPLAAARGILEELASGQADQL
jgi:orotidine-5'-phosphate decarboxylase